MESSKKHPVPNTLAFSSIFLSLFVCFVTLVHLEVELHSHRQMLQVLSHQRMDNFGPRKTLHDEPISSLHSSDAGEGKKMGECFFLFLFLFFIFYKLFTGWDIAPTVHDPGYITLNFHEVISNKCENNSNMYSRTSITRAVLGKGHCDFV